MAVQIARIEHGSLQVDKKTFGTILDKAGNLPVAIVAVTGPLHRGKSNIANQLLRYLTTPTDRGEDMCHRTITIEDLWKDVAAHQSNEILLWPEPLVTTSNGQSLAVLVMVVHGSLDNAMAKETALVFSFGCLLSSVMVYNVKRDLSEDVLQFLYLTIANAKAIHTQDDPTLFAKLQLVINDWQPSEDYALGLHSDQNSPSERNFKKERLDAQIYMLPEGRVIRQEILSSFNEVSCYLIPSPNAAIDRGDTVLFEEPLQNLAKNIFTAQCIIKKVHGKEVTGSEMMELVVKWAGLLARANIPPASTVAEATAEVQNEVAVYVSLKFFGEEMVSALHEDKCPTDRQLCEIYVSKKKEAMAMLERMRPTDKPVVYHKYVAMLEGQLEETLEACVQITSARRQISRAHQRTQKQVEVNKKKGKCRWLEVHRKTVNLNTCTIILITLAGIVLMYFINTAIRKMSFSF